MTRQSYQSSKQKLVLTSLIVNDEVLGSVAAGFKNKLDLFPDRWSNTVAQWCLSYYQEHHRAPQRAILNLFRRRRHA